MHWRFVILNKSDCYWQSAIVCLVFKVKKKARQTIYCFTLHCLVIAYYWTKNDQNVTIYSSVPHSTLLCISTDQHITTVQFYCTESTYQHLPRCTPLHRTPTIKPLYATFFHWPEMCATLRHRTFRLNPHEVAVQGSDQHCTQLYITVQYINQHCITQTGTVIGTN